MFVRILACAFSTLGVEQLIQYDSNLDLVPQLAVTWRLVEPTAWEFELRPNVRFHDGTPLTAADVVFSFARAKTELPWGLAGFIESIADVRAIDEHTVRIETTFPDPLLTLVKDTAITLPSGSSR